jgi:hypothetical protein
MSLWRIFSSFARYRTTLPPFRFTAMPANAARIAAAMAATAGAAVERASRRTMLDPGADTVRSPRVWSDGSSYPTTWR